MENLTTIQVLARANQMRENNTALELTLAEWVERVCDPMNRYYIVSKNVKNEALREANRE